MTFKFITLVLTLGSQQKLSNIYILLLTPPCVLTAVRSDYRKCCKQNDVRNQKWNQSSSETSLFKVMVEQIFGPLFRLACWCDGNIAWTPLCWSLRRCWSPCWRRLTEPSAACPACPCWWSGTRVQPCRRWSPSPLNSFDGQTQSAFYTLFRITMSTVMRRNLDIMIF